LTVLSPADAKVRLFHTLFRGREDIYARCFESGKTGKSGYAPACANEWVRGVCEKPRIKCAECLHRRFLAVTDDVIRWHLSGFNADDEPFVAGIYPLLPDETCWFLAIDFDKSSWREDTAACLETSRHLNLPAALERSRHAPLVVLFRGADPGGSGPPPRISRAHDLPPSCAQSRAGAVGLACRKIRGPGRALWF
jgi:hypothetical protein